MKNIKLLDRRFIWILLLIIVYLVAFSILSDPQASEELILIVYGVNLILGIITLFCSYEVLNKFLNKKAWYVPVVCFLLTLIMIRLFGGIYAIPVLILYLFRNEVWPNKS